MNSLGTVFIFIGELLLGIFLLWQWLHVRERLKSLEQRVAESLDDQDLIDFQERVVKLLNEVRETGKLMVQQIEQRRGGLDKEMAKAREAEKRLATKIQAFDRSQEKARTKIEEWVLDLGRRTAKAVPVQPPDPRIRRNPVAEENPMPAAASKPLKVSYLSRESRPAVAETSETAAMADKHQKIYELADKGLSVEKIAKSSGFLAGEIELILNLRRPRPRG
ncbi:MAG: hypothetical protein V4498_00915 [candidate division FCPU426 bacterium]